MASSSTCSAPQPLFDDVYGTYLPFFYVRRTLLRMLHDRGYFIPDSDLSATIPDFRELFGDFPLRCNLTIRSSHLSSPSDKIIVVFPDPPVNVDTFKTLIQQMKDESVLRSIMVVRQPLKKLAKDCIPIMDERKYSVEIFLESELFVNIMEHAFVPKHVSLNLQEKKELLERFKIEEEQLPYLLEDDPVARYYGFMKGEIIKIFRTDGDACEEQTFYRLVVQTTSDKND